MEGVRWRVRREGGKGRICERGYGKKGGGAYFD